MRIMTGNCGCYTCKKIKVLIPLTINHVGVATGNQRDRVVMHLHNPCRQGSLMPLVERVSGRPLCSRSGPGEGALTHALTRPCFVIAGGSDQPLSLTPRVAANTRLISEILDYRSLAGKHQTPAKYWQGTITKPFSTAFNMNRAYTN